MISANQCWFEAKIRFSQLIELDNDAKFPHIEKVRFTKRKAIQNGLLAVRRGESLSIASRVPTHHIDLDTIYYLFHFLERRTSPRGQRNQRVYVVGFN
jgi:hypothetical protein